MATSWLTLLSSARRIRALAGELAGAAESVEDDGIVDLGSVGQGAMTSVKASSKAEGVTGFVIAAATPMLLISWRLGM